MDREKNEVIKDLFFLVGLLGLIFVNLSACSPPRSSELVLAPALDNPTLILATTTSTQDSGLLDMLIPLFEGQSGYTVKTIAVGTGAALKMAEEGNADVLLVHAPDAEERLMEAGFGKDRVLVMHNDFVIVGPANDPAGINSILIPAEAFSLIAESGSLFVSRGDDSGTNKKELSIWSKTNFDPNAEKPEWYLESGQGMSTSLIIASQKEAYTLTDRATFLTTKQNLSLEITTEGDIELLNIYHVITVNQDAWPASNYDGANAFVNFITHPDIQSAIAIFGLDQFGQQLFFPVADKTDADLGLD